jgi:taurine dioxygenase
MDVSGSLGEEERRTLRDALREHLVIRIRGQKLSDEDLMRVGEVYGKLEKAPISSNSGPEQWRHPEITIISNVIENGKPIGGLGNYEAEWHTDMSYVERTPTASLLYSLEVPETGGDTGFSNMYLAYKTLPDDLMAAIEGRQCKHDASRDSAGDLRRGFHPLVRTHPDTGEKALFLGRRRNAYVTGLPLEESEALLDRLWAHATRPEFCWYHQWRVGDLVIWDNRSVMHRRDVFDANARRIMHRAQVVGDRPQ